MATDKFIRIKEYFNKIKGANKELTKKEIFKDLLNRLYVGNAETERIIDDITFALKKRLSIFPAHPRPCHYSTLSTRAKL